MDDFTINVRQIWQYPLKTPVGSGDLILLQQGDGGAYASITAGQLVETGLLGGGNLELAAGFGLQWDGLTLTASSGFFNFNSTVTAPTFQMGSAIVATQPFVIQQIDQVTASIQMLSANTVSSFNFRTGDVQLMDVDILRAGGVLQTNPVFAGLVIAPTPWDPNENDNVVATTAFVQAAICNSLTQLLACQVVTTFNGRFGAVTLIVDDVNAAYAVPGAMPTAPTPPSGDVSTRIATTAFVDDSVATLQDWIVLNYVPQQLSLYAPLNSPQFTGIPSGPTANPGTSTGQLATTSFVQHAISASTAGVASFNTRTGIVTLTAADITGAGGALLASPTFTGTPLAPTAAPATNTTQIATTAFVTAAIAALGGGVTSFNTRTGAVTLTLADVTATNVLNNTSLTGIPTAPTAAPGTSTTQVATTAFVQAAITAGTAGVSSFNSRTGAVTLTSADVSAAGGALVASPTFTGVPAAPTAAPSTNTTQIATTAFVQAALTTAGGVTSFNTRTGAVTLTTADITGAGGAPVASPSFTGTPLAPTAAPGNSTTQLATTAFVTAAIAAGLVSPAFSGVPSAPTAAPGTNTTQLATTAFVTAAVAANPGVTAFNGRTGSVTLTSADVSAAGGALIASPTFTGTPAAPTAVAGTNTTQIATTAFVTAAIGAITGAGVSSFNTRTGAVTLTLADVTGTGVLASPPLTGVPTAPTAAPGTSTTQIATTAFVTAAAAPAAAKVVRVFTASGTWTPGAGMVSAIIECVGGGAGGGGAGGTVGSTYGGGGGSGGAYSRRLVTAAQVGASQAVTIGAGGTGLNNASGGAGGTTSVGSLCIAPGGQPGVLGNTSQFGAGGFGNLTGAVGDISVIGGGGDYGEYYPTPSGGLSIFLGRGGRSRFGEGAPPMTASGSGIAGQGYGAGGCGGFAANTAATAAGGPGTPGVVIITEFGP